jgi:SAM-dependent methyltransferase
MQDSASENTVSATETTINAVAESEAEYFNKYVGDDGEFDPFLEQGWATIRKRFETMIEPTRGLHLLDVGCGTGQSRQIYAAWADSYTGIDLSQKALARAQHKFPNDTWLYADACAMPFQDDSFDVVAFSSVLHHIPDYGLAVQEAFRVLKPGGKAFAYDPNILHPAMKLLRDPDSKFYTPEGVSPNERPLHPTALYRVFEVAGFHSIYQRGQSHIPYRAVAPKGLNAALTAYNVLDRLWEGVGLSKRYGTFVITTGIKPTR